MNDLYYPSEVDEEMLSLKDEIENGILDQKNEISEEFNKVVGKRVGDFQERVSEGIMCTYDD